MSSNDIISARLTAQRGSVRETMDVGANEVRFTSEDADDRVLPVVSHVWKGRFLSQGLQDRLREGTAAKAATAANEKYQYRLSTTSGAGQTQQIVWDSGLEPPDLRKARESIERVADLRAEEAKRALAAGESTLAEGAFDKAIADFKRGLRTLGVLFRKPSSRDDSGQKLVAGEVELKAGHKNIAASIFRNVLDQRVKRYAALDPLP